MERLIIAIAAIAVTASGAFAQVAETPDIAAKIKALGPELSREMIGGTFALYKPLHQNESDDGLKVTRNVSYGPHERNALDVYAPEDADGTQPILIFAHGGGFVRGDKAGAQNIGRWFARHGVVAIPINYRFAPDNVWPSGAEDVKMALQWIAANSDVHKGDASKIVLSGNSAGTMHVADYTFRENMQADNDGVIGAIIISPPTVAMEGREIDPKRDALYYGTDGNRNAQSVINALDGRKIPLMIAYAENEPDLIIDQTRILVEGVTKRDGRLPLIYGVPGHNHISIVEHIGTADESLAQEMLGFIRYLAH